MRCALVHDWLTGRRGGEHCLEAFLSLYPDADIFTLVHVPGATSERIDRNVKGVSFLRYFPKVEKYYRALLPLYPFAARSLDLSGYDLVISLSHAAAKNVSVPKGCVHVCYCFTPMRYIWDQIRFYLGGFTVPAWPLVSLLRKWDVRGSKGVTHFVSISKFVSARIRKFYGRKATVIYPPVDTAWVNNAQVPEAEKGKLELLMQPAFLYAGALVPYKRPEVVVEAFKELGLPLWVVGDGPELEKLKRIASSNITFFGRASDGLLAAAYRRCRALIFPGIEDFGMVPVECMAAGRPVIAIHAGATKETVRGSLSTSRVVDPHSTGVFIPRKQYGSARGLIEALHYFIDHEHLFNAQAGQTSEICKEQAARFSIERFTAGWVAFASGVGIPPRSGGGSNSNEEMPRVRCM